MSADNKLILSDVTYTLQTCNLACNKYSWCTNWWLGKNGVAGYCALYGSGCTEFLNPNYEFYEAVANTGNTKTFEISIQQVMDCSSGSAMTTKASNVANVPVNPLLVTYSASATLLDYTSTYLNIFEHLDPTNCPVTSCTLMANGCNSGLAVSTSFFLTAASTPWRVQMKQNVQIGWGEINFCYECVGTNPAGGTYF